MLVFVMTVYKKNLVSNNSCVLAQYATPVLVLLGCCFFLVFFFNYYYCCHPRQKSIEPSSYYKWISLQSAQLQDECLYFVFESKWK